MIRPDFPSYLLALAKVAATRATCAKRQVGAVVADAERKIISTGYNGVPAGQPHCINNPCDAVALAAPASHLRCLSIHAEANALMLAGRLARGGWLAVTTTPCAACALLIANSDIKHLVVGEVNRLWENVEDYQKPPSLIIADAAIEVHYL